MLFVARLTIVVVVCLLVPVSAPAATYAGGVVPKAVYEHCAKRPYNVLTFDFAGRMPAGQRFYQVISGHASARWECSLQVMSLSMTGQTLKGVFSWVCTGAVKYKHDGVPIQTVVDALDDLIGVPPVMKALRAGPGYLYTGRCTTVGRAGSFRLQVVLETVRDVTPFPDVPAEELVGAYKVAVS